MNEDQYNDETFGEISSSSGSLPSFFQNPGTTLADELANWSLSAPPGLEPPGLESVETRHPQNEKYQNSSEYTSQDNFYQNHSPQTPSKGYDTDNFVSPRRSDRPQIPIPYPQMQVLQGGPGVLPPPQSLASLSTPGAGSTWYAGYVSKENRAVARGGTGRGSAGRVPSGRNSHPGRFFSPQKSNGVPDLTNSKIPIAPTLSANPNTIAPTLSTPIDMRPDSSQMQSAPSVIVTPGSQPNRFSQKQFGQNLRTGSIMNSSDVKFVVSKVLQMTETQDPYNEDFYYIQTMLKKNNRKIQDAILTNSPPPPLLPVPLPTWTETQVRVKRHIEETRKHFEDRSRAWEEKEGVLGHVVKSNFKAPKTVLAVPSAASNRNGDNPADGDNEENEEEGDRIVPFAGVVWTMRQAAYRGYSALYTVHELQTLLLTPLVGASPLIRDEILHEASSCQTILSKSVGVRLSDQAATPSSGLQIDGGLVAALLQTSKGKKLMTRSLSLLPAEQRWSLIPMLVSRLLQRDPAEQSPEDIEAETFLLDCIEEFVNCESQSIARLAPPPGLSTPHQSGHYDTEELVSLLARLRQTIKSVVIAQMERTHLRHAVRSSRRRSEIMQSIMRLGDRVVESVGQESKKTDWEQLRDTFMQMLTE